MITDLHAVSVKQIDKLILHLPFPNAFCYVSVFCQLAFWLDIVSRDNLQIECAFILGVPPHSIIHIYIYAFRRLSD